MQRLPLPLSSKRATELYYWIWQDDLQGIPWVICVSGTTDKTDVTIYHEDLPEGRSSFYRQKFRTPAEFLRFCKSIINMYAAFGYRMEFRQRDALRIVSKYIEGSKTTARL